MRTARLTSGQHFPIGKILCIGRNYAEHIKELGNATPEAPVIFIKPASAVIGEGEEIVIPSYSHDCHHEAELTLLIGRKGKDIPVNQAMEYIAGYGVGIRLELLQVPLVFAIGQALVVLVGTHIGANRPHRAKRIAWTGAGLASAVSAFIGLGAALFPAAWITLFSSDPAVLEAGSQYLRIVGPFYPLFGINIALYFASQGRGRVGWPVFAGTMRLLIVVAGGAAAVALGAPLWSLFAVLALGISVMGSVTAWAVHKSDWGR